MNDEIIPLWSGPAPHSLGSTENDIPTLTLFHAPDSAPDHPAVIICPGGGYGMLCMDYEGTDIGAYFQAHGVSAFVLKYRLPGHGYRHPSPLLDAQHAVRLVRSRAQEWKINPSRIGIVGFSAGGHLASTAATHFDAGDPAAPDPIDRCSCRPDFAVLVMPVISLKPEITNQGTADNLLGPTPDPALVAKLSSETQVTSATPPILLIHAADDTVVPIENSRRMLTALLQAGVPCDLHEYPECGHAFNHTANRPAGWLDRAYGWLKGQGLVG